MSKYTVRGSAELDARIDADLERIAEVAKPYGSAGILLGGYGRGEGTPFICPDGGQTPFNDYDLVVIVDRLDNEIRQKLKDLERALSSEIGLPVDLYPYEKRLLPECEFSLLNHEMKFGHKVVWGDQNILDAMPDYPHDAIPRSEGARLLLNRGKLLLDIKRGVRETQPLSNEDRLRVLKFMFKTWLALGDCALLAEGKYDLSYRIKRQRITSIDNVPNRAIVIEEYLNAVDLKEWGDYQSQIAHTDIAEAFRRVRDVFIEFLLWYKKRYSTRECSILKAMLLNLKWNHWPYPDHPRKRLYEALPELLNDQPDPIVLGQILCCSRDVEKRFYDLQARFS